MLPTESTGKSQASRQPDSRSRSLVGQLTRWEKSFLIIGLVATVMRHGSMYQESVGELSLIICLAILIRVGRIWLEWWLSDNRSAFVRAHPRRCLFTFTWSCGVLILGVLGMLPPVWQGGSRIAAIVGWSELFLLLAGLSRLLLWVSSITTLVSPARIFVVSFIGLILVGTALLMLPGSQTDRARQDDLHSRLRNAVFTSTSASCVTGLATVDTGGDNPYWTRFGQCVILALFQIGGLGIMSLGATYTLLLGRSLAPKQSTAVSEVTEAVTMGDVRSLLLSILAVTLFCEAIGAVLMMTLWPEKPILERFFFGTFHSISAFCNAGFALTDQSFAEYGTRWQVWGVLSLLIIVGGLGFGTLQSLFTVLRSWITDRRERVSLFAHRRPSQRLPLSSRIVLWMSLLLCAGGAGGIFLLEATGPDTQEPVSVRCAQAWFQSVTFRTAGFNTVEHGELQPATKLFAVGLMFIGAAPGSTGGGVKVVAIAIIALALMSILKGRRNVEYHGRTIPDQQIRMAFVIISMGLATTLTTTLLLTLFESDEAAFLNYLFEATSAYATVGVSTGITGDLSPASQVVLIITMFLGRVGPLTVMIALTDQQDVSYQYPSERVALG